MKLIPFSDSQSPSGITKGSHGVTKAAIAALLLSGSALVASSEPVKDTSTTSSETQNITPTEDLVSTKYIIGSVVAGVLAIMVASAVTKRRG